MGESSYRKFFTRPKDCVHRRYECLRAVFVDGMAMQDAAERFKVAYGTVRNWAHEFRTVHDQRESPPFLFTQNGGVPLTKPRQNSRRKIRP